MFCSLAETSSAIVILEEEEIDLCERWRGRVDETITIRRWDDVDVVGVALSNQPLFWIYCYRVILIVVIKTCLITINVVINMSTNEKNEDKAIPAYMRFIIGGIAGWVLQA